jgi:hypothetical protein
MPLERL